MTPLVRAFLLAGALALALTGCGGGQSNDADATDAVPRLILNGDSHELNDESFCHYQKNGKTHANVKTDDGSDAALRFWATPSESRSEVAMDVPDSPLAQGHGTWEDDDTGVFNGGLEAQLEDDRLTLAGTFESAVVDDYQVDVDFAIDCIDEP